MTRAVPSRRALLVAAFVAVASSGLTSVHAAPDQRVRPGLAFTSASGQCSFGFLLKGSDGAHYASTVGHCAGVEEQERIWSRGAGPPVSNDDRRKVGHFVYAVEDSPRNVDFGLIKLDRGVLGNPQMCGWGGPTSLLTQPRAGAVELRHHGRGLLIGTALPSRRAIVQDLPREPYTYVLGAIAPGDSGSAMTTADGAALGNVAELAVNGRVAKAGYGIVRLEHALLAAERRLGVRFKLRTAALLPAPDPRAAC